MCARCVKKAGTERIKKRKRKDDCPSKNTRPEKNAESISNDAYLDNNRLEKESPK